jgi:adenine phosphoribosyltransferase
MNVNDLRDLIRNVPDFPNPGIQFKDVTTLLKDPEGLKQAITELKGYCVMKDFDVIAGIEARGFILASILAHDMGVGFVPLRKKGKLPAETVREEYVLEYGTDGLEMHADAIKPGQNVLIVDDLLATGGTASAAVRLVERAGGRVAGICFLTELSYLEGRDKLKGYDVFSLIQYDD